MKRKNINKFFRASVVIVVYNEKNEILTFERINADDVWQLPQGGIKDLEDNITAGLRELLEETNIHSSDVLFLAEYPDWLAYELPTHLWNEKVGRGQVQKFLCFKFIGNPNNIQPLKVSTPEFKSWKWMTKAQLLEKTNSFRVRNYELALTYFEKFHPNRKLCIAHR